MCVISRSKTKWNWSARGFKGMFKYLFAIPSLFQFPDEMAATANRFANESSPFARMMLVYLHDSVLCTIRSRETSCSRSGKNILTRSFTSSSFAFICFFPYELKKFLLRGCWARSEINSKQHDKANSINPSMLYFIAGATFCSMAYSI